MADSQEKILSDVVKLKSEILKGDETVLLVENDEGVRLFSERALISMGYKVHQAENGVEALNLIKNFDLNPDLLITDIIMPGMDGKEVSERIRTLLPKIRVIYTSGYTDNHIVTQGFLNEEVHFLEKPYSIFSLSTKIRQALDIT